MRPLFLLLFSILILHAPTGAQSYVFAQLQGTPLNTTGWNLQGAATVGDVTGTGNNDLILTTTGTNQSGAVFFNQPINLSQCNSWTAEFDFRINGGSMADGLAFCFLDVPPVGFVSGGGLGIPGSANGLKVCFDTYNNCGESPSTMPKIELRWGLGYNECWSQPTLYNNAGNLSFLRSSTYNRAKIVYSNGNISVYVNNVLYLTGTQTFNFTGYFGFTAATGSLTDNHSIRNVVIYTNMPPSEAGPNVTICSGSSATIGHIPNLLYAYQWTPTTGLSNPNSANPQVTLTNNGNTPITTKYYVSTTFTGGNSCASVDSVLVTVLPAPSLGISASTTTVCAGLPATFTATATNAGATTFFEWFVNGTSTSVTGTSFTSSTLNNGDVVTCILSTPSCGAVTSNSITMSVTPGATPTVSITSSASTVCPGGNIQFTASATPNTGVSYQWKKNGINVGGNSSSYSDNSWNNGDQVLCEITASGPCVSGNAVSSNTITASIQQPPALNLGSNTSICPGTSLLLDAGNGFATYQWNTGATTATINVTIAGNYSVIGYTPLGCPAYDTINIGIHPAPLVGLGAPSALCTGATRTLDAGSFANYTWNNGSNTRTITVSAPGTYTVQVTDANGCTGTGTTSITTIHPLPSGFLPLDTAICSYGSLDLQPTTTFSSYQWNTGSSTSTLSINAPGTYWLEATDNNGCRGRDSIDVAPKQCMKGLYVPNGFTPNADGKNDVFKPLIFGPLKAYELIVYNRWGNVVFRTTQPSKGWNGNIEGARQASEVFVWLCRYRFDGEGEKVERGTVLLVR